MIRKTFSFPEAKVRLERIQEQEEWRERHIKFLWDYFSKDDFSYKFKTSGVDSEMGVGMDLTVCTAVPEKPIMFLGETVSLEDGYLYLSKVMNAESVRCCRINKIISRILGFPVSTGASLAFIEKFKLTGKIDGALQLCLEENEADEGSFISRTILDYENSLKSFEDFKLSEIVERMKRVQRELDDLEDFVGTIYHLAVMGAWKQEGRGELISSMGSVWYRYSDLCQNTRTSLAYIHGDWYLWMTSLEAYWTDYNEIFSLASKNLPENTRKFLNAVEIAEALGDNEMVETSDYKTRLNELGFDRILTKREINSINTISTKKQGRRPTLSSYGFTTAQLSAVGAIDSKRDVVDRNLTGRIDDVPLADAGTSMVGEMESGISATIRNSLIYSYRLVSKVNEIMKG